MMWLIEQFRSASPFNQLSFILSIIATLTAWISFFLPAWGYNAVTDVYTAKGYGLWWKCSREDLTAECTSLIGSSPAWYQALQAFATLGWIGINVTFVLILLQVFCGKCFKSCMCGKSFKGCEVIAFANCIQSVLTGLCYLVAIFVFAVKFDCSFKDFNYPGGIEMGPSWGLAIVAFLINAMAIAFLQFLESTMNKKPPDAGLSV